MIGKPDDNPKGIGITRGHGIEYARSHKAYICGSTSFGCEQER